LTGVKFTLVLLKRLVSRVSESESSVLIVWVRIKKRRSHSKTRSCQDTVNRDGSVISPLFYEIMVPVL